MSLNRVTKRSTAVFWAAGLADFRVWHSTFVALSTEGVAVAGFAEIAAWPCVALRVVRVVRGTPCRCFEEGASRPFSVQRWAGIGLDRGGWVAGWFFASVSRRGGGQFRVCCDCASV